MTVDELEAELTPLVRKGETGSAIERLERELRLIPETPFHEVLGLSFTNSAEQVARRLEELVAVETLKYPVAAIYTELNEFAFNTAQWHFDLFAYKNYGGHEDYDWIAYWDSDDVAHTALTGMETLQGVYEANDGSADRLAEDVCSLLVIARFQDLVRRAVAGITSLDGPVLATAHDYDFIAEFRPPPKIARVGSR